LKPGQTNKRASTFPHFEALESQGYTVLFRFKVASVILAAGLLAKPLSAQVTLGYLTTSMTGNVAPGYTATFGNQTAGSHGWAIGGAGTLTGSYYSPSFFSFNADYYLNQSRANSNFQSITNASGVDVSSNIFGGSHFPGSVTYSKSFNSEGNYAIPGVANYVTHGDSDTFGVNWSESVPDKPSLSAGFQMGGSQYTVYGTNDAGTNHFRSVNLHSGYSLAGFTLGSFYSKGDSNSLIPQAIAGQAQAETRTGGDNYGFNVSHRLPLQGSLSGGFTRSQFDTDYLGVQANGTIDVMNAVGILHPLKKVSLTGNVNYSDNLSGQLIQSIVGTSGAAQTAAPGTILDTNQTSNALDLLGVATYTPSDDSQVSLSVERREQTFLGSSYGVNSYGVSGSYTHRLFEGNLNSAASMTANSADNSGQDTLGFTVTEGYSTKVLGWNLTGNFSYAQDVQTLLVTYMNSFYNYSASAHRNFGRFNLGASGSASHTALTDHPGTSNANQGYSANMGYGRWITASGSYSEGSGQALITGSGLVPIPVPPPVLPSSLVSMYGGRGYSFGAASTPTKRLTLQASWSRSNSDTASAALTSTNQNEQFNTLMQYQFRKLSFNSGYARLEQGFSGTAGPPQVVSSFYMGASRWFKFF
jgi:hypothetical protein